MEWANGDVRINLARDGPFSRIPERGGGIGGENNPHATVVRGDFSVKTHMPQNMVGKNNHQPQQHRMEVNPNYFHRTASVPYAGMVPHDYNQSKKYHNTNLPAAAYQLERQEEVDSSRSLDYPSLPRGFSTMSVAYASGGPPSDDSCSQTCAECPGGGAPCDYGPGDPSGGGYSLVDMAPSGMAPEPPDTYTMELPGGNSGHPPPIVMPTTIPVSEFRSLQAGIPVSDFRSIQSHASQCNIRDFEEYRGLRGSRESLGSLPPDLEQHLQNCRCQCDHLGYGNYQTLIDSGTAVSNISLSLNEAAAALYGGRPDAQEDKSGTGASTSSGGPTGQDYTQISFLDSPTSASSNSNGFPTRRKAPGELSPKHWWLVGLVFLVAVTAGVGVGVPLAFRGDPTHDITIRMARAKTILRESPLIDGHNDLPWNIRNYVHNQLEDVKLNESLKDFHPWKNSNWSHTDIPRLKRGMVGGQFWSAYAPCESQGKNSIQLTLEQIDVIKRMIKKYGDYMTLVTNSQDINKVFKQGKLASLIGIEGGHCIGNSLGTLRMVYELGVRYLTLTHTCNTLWATSSKVEDNPDEKRKFHGEGLSSFGKKVVLEMNRLGMMVDLSHVSTQTMRDALATSRAPVIFSHAAARTICNISRNVPDDVLKQIHLNKGIVMVSFYADHISCTGNANVTSVINHINHIRKVAGIDHVGIGADFDGINRTPKNLKDVGEYPNLVAELLLDPSWTATDIQKLTGQNIVRVLAEVEKRRDELQAQGYLPQDEEIDQELIKKESNCSYFPRIRAGEDSISY